MKSKGYKEFEVYKTAHRLGVVIHRFSLKLPKFELYETGSQIRRSSKSVSVNIVEGYGRRRYQADYIHFLVYAQASCDETIEWIEYIKDCYEELINEADRYLDEYNELGRKLNKFITAVESRT